MNKISKIMKLILTELFKSEHGLALSTIHYRLLIAPSEIVRTISELENKSYVLTNNLNVTLTKTGREFIIQNLSHLNVEKDMSWRKCPDSFIRTKLEPNTPYIPKVSLLDTKFFKIEDSKQTTND